MIAAICHVTNCNTSCIGYPTADS